MTAESETFRWIFHVGFPKAASSTLQAAFRDCGGAFYVGRGKGGVFQGSDSRDLIRHVLTGYSADQYPVREVERWRAEIESLAAMEHHRKILVSEERFLSTPTVPRSLVEISRLLKRAFGDDVHLVIVLRNPMSLLKSVYAQRVKLGLAIEFQHFCANVAAYPHEEMFAQYDFANLLRALQNENVRYTALIFERLISEPGYAASKLSTLGLSNIPDALSAQNVSPNSHQLEAIRRQNLKRFENLSDWPIATRPQFLVSVDRKSLASKAESLDALGGTTGKWLSDCARFLKIRNTNVKECHSGPTPIDYSIHPKVRKHLEHRFAVGNRDLEQLVGEKGLTELGYPASVADDEKNTVVSKPRSSTVATQLKWIFHVGYAKAGSSSLQAAFRQAKGVHFIGKDRSRFLGSHGHYVVHQMLPRAATHQIDTDRFEQWKLDAERSAIEKGVTTILVSEERFLNPLVAPRSFLESAATLIDLFGDQLEFIISLRNPFDLLRATFTHRLKFGLAIDFQQFCFLQAAIPHGNIIQQQNYSSLLAGLQDRGAKVTTLTLEKFSAQKNYVAEKLAPLGITGIPENLPFKNVAPDSRQLQTLLQLNSERMRRIADLPAPVEVEMLNRAELDDFQRLMDQWQVTQGSVVDWIAKVREMIDDRRCMATKLAPSDQPLDLSMSKPMQQWLEKTLQLNVSGLEELTGEFDLRELGYPV